jgi:hypothetical protein
MARSSLLRAAFGLILALAVSAGAIAEDAPAGSSTAPIAVGPSSATLNGKLDRLQLQVSAPDGSRDLTREVQYSVAPEGLAKIDVNGQVTPLQNGEGRIVVSNGDAKNEIRLTITNAESTDVSFAEQIVPVLTKAGCNQGACHASQYGKGNFKLSLLGFAPEQDHSQFVRDWQQRRVSFISPDESLILKKAMLEVSHGGGQRFRRGSFEHAVMLDWLKAGAAKPKKDEAHVVGMTVTPTERVYRQDESQQLRVVAKFSDGTERDVTHIAKYDSMGEGVATVNAAGLVTAVGPGQAPIMIRYQGQALVSLVLQPRPGEVDLSGFVASNFIDEELKKHWVRLGIKPVGLCSDEVFLRRAFLDSIGTLPSPEKIAAFLNSDAKDKRARVIDELLGLTGDSKRDIYNNEFSAYWSLKWGDLLRNNRNKVGDGGMWAFYNWMRASFRENKPFDQFAREIITAQGSIYANGPANYYKIATTPQDLAETTAQVFLGVRLQCAKCHHHPFEVYSQADYYGLAAYFTRVGTKGSADFGALGRDSVVMIKSSGSISHPRTRKTMQPTPLLGEPSNLDGVRDFRKPLAVWLTSPENKLFARNVVNRFWGYFMGEGLVEPIDDLRATNPAAIPALLDALSADFTENGYDVRKLLRAIMTSRAYQLASTPLPENVESTRLQLHYNVKRLPAEALLDAIDHACGTQERFKGVPLGTRAIELPDSNYPSYFLDTTGRPKRVVTCECERTSDPNLAAVLHLINGDVIQRKLLDKNGRLAKFIANKTEIETAIRECYLVTYCREPSAEELKYAQEFFASAKSPTEGYQDILWALLNTPEFLFNH